MTYSPKAALHGPHDLRLAARFALGLVILLCLLIGPTPALAGPRPAQSAPPAPDLADGAAQLEPLLRLPFIRSVDTMKESRDFQRVNPFTDTEIAHSVATVASLNVDYVAVATNWEYPEYLRRWVQAVRAAGKKVWFRAHPDRWTRPGSAPMMTPPEYLDELRRFVRGYPDLFEDGDIFDPGQESEAGVYWEATWGRNWSWQPQFPNDATRAFNVFLRESQLLARALMAEIGRPGVITTVRSMNGWWAQHPNALEHETVAVIGAITLDSYPDANAVLPAEAVRLRLEEIEKIWRLWGRPILIGELGYPLVAVVSDETQREAVGMMLDAIMRLPYVLGVNYWVGAPNPSPRDYRSAIFEGRRGAWTLRPAAHALAASYASAPLLAARERPLPVPWRYGPDLARNGGFEDGDHWRLDAEMARTADAANAGERGLRIPGMGGWSNASQEILLERNTCYVVSALIRGPGGARLDVLDPNWQTLAVTELRAAVAWQRVTLPFQSRGQTRIVLALRDSGNDGPVDVDEVQLRRCPSAAEE